MNLSPREQGWINLGFSQEERKKIRALDKRILHLTDRIEQSERDLSYDRAELAALVWALEIIRASKTVVTSPELQHALKRFGS